MRIFEKFLRYSSVLKTIALRSSAEISEQVSFCAKMTPVRFFVNFIFKANISTHKKKMYGEITSPCGTPCSRIIFLDRWPPNRIRASLLSKKSLIHF